MAGGAVRQRPATARAQAAEHAAHAPEQRLWLLHDIEALLERAALTEPLLICLDDLHWADNGTAAALRSLPRRLAGFPIGWILSTRAGQGPPQVESALTGLVADGATRLVLGPLSEDAVDQLLADLLDATPDGALLRAAERVRGNPFLLVELVAAWRKSAWLPSRKGEPPWSTTACRGA